MSQILPEDIITFVAGTKAKSAEVNANIQALVTGHNNTDQKLTNLRIYNVADYGNDIAATITDAGSNHGYIYHPKGTYTLTTNINYGSNVAWFGSGAELTAATSKTVTFNNTPVYENAFVGSNITLSGLYEINVKMFGAIGDGNISDGTGTDNSAIFQKFFNTPAKKYIIPTGVYRISVPITVDCTRGVDIIGFGKYNSIILINSLFENIALELTGTGGLPSSIRGLGIYSQIGGSPNATVGLKLGKNGTWAEDIWVNGINAGIGIMMAHTDQFLSNFAVEYNLYGINNITSNQNVSNGTVYECSVGAIANNSTELESGPIIWNDIRANQCTQVGFSVSSGHNVTISNCASHSVNPDRFMQGDACGFNIDASSRVSLSNCTASITNSAHVSGLTEPMGIKVTNSNNVQINNSFLKHWVNGVNISNSTNVSIQGNTCEYNSRYGISSTGGNIILLHNNTCSNNGTTGATLDAGIYCNNTAGYSIYSLQSNICTQNGGGDQDYGILSNLVDNGSATGQTFILNNVCSFNNTSQINLTGVTNKQSSFNPSSGSVFSYNDVYVNSSKSLLTHVHSGVTTGVDNTGSLV